MKQLDSLWIWPPGASGNFILKHYYGGDSLATSAFTSALNPSQFTIFTVAASAGPGADQRPDLHGAGQCPLGPDRWALRGRDACFRDTQPAGDLHV